MPALVANYQKNVTASRLKKFVASVQNIERLRENDLGGVDCSMVTENNNPDMMLMFWDVNFAPYMKTAGAPQKALPYGINVPLLDGGGFYLQKSNNCGAASPGGDCGCLYSLYCMSFKECFDGALNSSVVKANGKTKFAFRAISDFINYYGNATRTAMSRADLISACANTHPNADVKYYPYYECTMLIRYDGWEIKDDYPW
jgi:hypothetical protein